MARIFKLNIQIHFRILRYRESLAKSKKPLRKFFTFLKGSVKVLRNTWRGFDFSPWRVFSLIRTTLNTRKSNKQNGSIIVKKRANFIIPIASSRLYAAKFSPTKKFSPNNSSLRCTSSNVKPSTCSRSILGNSFTVVVCVISPRKMDLK